jgi:uncharacterized protein YacL
MKINFRTLLRPSLTIVFAFLGAVVARGGTPPAIFAITGEYFLLAAVLAFGTLGFILPEILELAGKAGIAALARAIVRYLPNPRSVDASGALNQLPFVKGARGGQKYVNPLVVDTSVLIDGRLVDVAKTGFIYGTLLVIPSVVSELHQLADSSDDLKRARGRRGLDALNILKKEKDIKLVVTKSDPKANNVDERLLKIATIHKAKLLTVDYNLNKVGNVRGVTILNLNELANAVKTVVLPHESLKVKVNTVGKEKNQGVAYLSDGTMVVVENGAKYKGKTVDIEVLRVLQTAAGKMIFGRLATSS